MAPHSPQRAGQGAPPPPPYAAPPPPYQPQWPVAPPNVYVSQVTANVNVHGYMGQYYQPQYERQPRPPRRTPRTKRGVSPPAQPPPYYVYPPYYSAAQAQGTPLYHMPMYQPVTYLGHYPYHHYYQPEFQMPVEGDGTDKGPEEYPQEVLMEQEAVEAYYAGAHYGGPPYGPPVEGPVEYMPPAMYLPPPQHQHPMQMAPQHTHQPPPHQFNVHAKNFVQNQHHNKAFSPPDRSHERRSPTSAASVSAAGSVENLPIKDLKIGKGPSSQGSDQSIENNQPKPSTSQSEALSPKTEAPKSSWAPTEVKVSEPAAQPPVKNFVSNLPTVGVNQVGPNKATASTVKVSKAPAAPFSGNKPQPPKPSIPATAVPVQQNVSIPKAPFGNRQKKDGPATRSPSNEATESTDRPLVVDHSKREPLLPPSKAPMPISITLHSQGQPLIVSNKTPFSHARKSLPAPEPAPQPPPPAPTASDFPPPPTPRNRGDPLSTTTASPVIPQQPASGKSWASLFSNKSIGSGSMAASMTDEPTSPTSLNAPAANAKPVAKVPPFDASPLLQSHVDKQKPTVPPTGISYSEKTSVNAMSNNVTPVKSASPTTSETREIPIQKEQTPSQPVQPSPYAEDPNSYRMGEFLSKYQLDHKSVMLLPRGLTNRSNYCYVNAILQALIACPPFYNMLKALPYQTRRGKSSTPVIDAMVELCYEFTPLPPNARVSRARSTESTSCGLPIQTGPPLDPAAGQKVLRALRPFPGSQEGRQEDAEEFLSCLLNGLNDEMLELIKLVEPEEPKDSQTNGIIVQEPVLEEDDDDDWKVMGPRNRGAVERQGCARRTPLGDIFRGRTRCRTHRAPANEVTDAVQPFFTLQLDIERSSNVKEALELLAGKDTLEGVSDAWQQLSIEQPPVVLLLHLKCFQLDSEGHTAKIVKNIDFPIELKIDPKVMSQKVKVTTKQRLYKLFAVVYHEGIEAVKGHYLTDTYHGQAGWIRYDDSTVTLVSESQVLKPKSSKMPYILMYRRQDMIPVSHRNTPKTE